MDWAPCTYLGSVPDPMHPYGRFLPRWPGDLVDVLLEYAPLVGGAVRRRVVCRLPIQHTGKMGSVCAPTAPGHPAFRQAFEYHPRGPCLARPNCGGVI